jgi:excinuclease ABC subunit C
MIGAAMKRAPTRRYKKQPLPDCLIDGGKGQLGIAKEVLTELGILLVIRYPSRGKGEGRKAGFEVLHPIDHEPPDLAGYAKRRILPLLFVMRHIVYDYGAP